MNTTLSIGIIVAGIIGSVVIFSSMSQDMWNDHRTETIGVTPDEIDEKINCLSKGGVWQYTSCSFEESVTSPQIEPTVYGTCSGTLPCLVLNVSEIIDGDTIYADSHKIRLSLTNTPEKGEPGFFEATAFTSMACPVGSTILVDQDDIQPYDDYGRLLGKVFCGNQILNEILLRNGHANILTQYCITSEFSGENWAQSYGCDKSELETIPSDCDPSYPDFCIELDHTDLDCSEISERNFTVLPPDPHKFDGDKDGIGCEK